MSDGKKPWEKYSKATTEATPKPWEKFSTVKKKESTDGTQANQASGSKSVQQPVKPSSVTEKQVKVQPSASSNGTSDLLKEISSVNRQLIDQEEEEVVPILNKKFNKHGFTFEQTGVGDKTIVTYKGKDKIEISLDNWTDSGDEEESLKLRKFLSTKKSLQSTEEAAKLFSKPVKTPKEQKRLKELTDRQMLLDNMFVEEFNQKDNKENYKQQAKKDLDEELNGEGILNTIRDAGKSLWNTAVENFPAVTPGGIGLKAYVSTLKTDKNTLEKNIRKVKSDPANSKLTPEQVKEKAYNNALDERADDLRQSEVRTYLSGMPDETKELLQADKILEQSTIEENIKEKELKHAAVLKIAEDKANKYGNIVKQFGENSPEALLLKKEVDEKIIDLQNIQKSLYADTEKIGSVDDEIDLLGRNYGALENFTGKYTSQAGKSVGGLVKTAIEFSGINPATKIAAVQKINEVMDDSENIKESLARPVSRVTNASDFIDYWSDLVATQAPDLITMALLGEAEVAAYGSTFLSQFGQKKREMEKEVESGKASYTANEMLLVPALYGSAEIVSEIPTFQILKKMGRVNKAIEADDVLRRELYSSVYDKVKGKVAGYGKDQLKEVAGEEFTNSIQNATDKYILGKKEVGIFDNAEAVIKDTALLTSTLQAAPHIFGAVTKPFTSPEYTKQLDQNSKAIAELIKKMDNPDTSDAVKSIIKDRIDEITASSEKIVKSVISNIDSMPDDFKDKIINIEKVQSELRAKASIIRDDKTIDINTKKELLEDLKNDFAKAEDYRIGVLNNDPKYVDADEFTNIKEVAPEVVTEQTTQEEVAELLRDVESTTNALNEVGGENDLKNELAKKIDDEIKSLRDENGNISDDNLDKFKSLKKAKESINRGVVRRPEGGSMSSRNSDISEEYHKAKVDGSNPELVKAVEFLLAPKITEQTTQEEVTTPQATEMSVITPEKSSNFANLTQDEEGNAVFFHVGDAGYETIKPSSGQSTRTSNAEAAAIGKVGGVAMYYTSPNDSETMVTGPGKYAVKVPIEKVYDFNTDENNYLEEAQKRHEAENPGKAMDANSELAYITKIAGENGYDMVVADWGGKTRAQTTKELTPTDTQVSRGEQVTKTFDEKYVPNTEKGFVSVVPESKDSKFQKIYDKIYKYRNSQQNYDALYKLSTSSLDREGVTKLVNESDLPQDLKDEYNKVLNSRDKTRRSVKYQVTKPVTVEGAPEGDYLNVGLNIGLNGDVMSNEEVKDSLPEGVEVLEENVENVESEVDGKKITEPTLVLKLSRKLTDSEMKQMVLDNQQIAITQMNDGIGVLHGSDRYGDFDPKFFYMPDNRKLSDVVSKEQTVEQEVEKISELFSTDINKAVENAKAALANLLPNVKFVIHDSYDSYTKAVGDEDVESGGTYMSSTNTIHINKRAATKTTVAHEVFHALLINMVGTDVKAGEITKRMINALSKQLDNNPDLKEYLDNFIASYDENIKNEEKAAELFGYLAANYETLPKQSQSLIKRWMEALAKMFGFKPFTDNEVVDFFNTLSEKVATGQEITSLDVKAISTGTPSSIGNPVNITRNSKGAALRFTETPANLSFVTDKDKIDINSLINEIIDKKQKIWFWMADQLGRGNYYDSVIDGEHYLDAGPSFALDPINKKEGVLWASGLAEKTLNAQIEKADYIFFISGSPDKSKLFNKRVLDLTAARINSNSNFDEFKKAINDFPKETNDLKDIKEALNKVNSFEELSNSTKRKSFLISIDKISKAKTSPEGSLNSLLKSFNAFVDYNTLRDGFYKDNNFSQNDIMLVGKPTGLGGKAIHSTYETAILGEVVGVPDKKIDSWEIMPKELKDKYKKIIEGRESKTKPLQAKVIAAETGVVRELDSSAKKQTSVIANKVKAAKQAGFSDAAISQYLQNNGYTAEQASKGLLDYNKKEIQKAQKEDGIFLKDANTRIKNFLGNIRRRLASARGFMPRSVFLSIEDKASKIEVQAKMVSNTSRRFDKLLSKYQGDKEALLVDFDSYIRGDKSINLPSEFKAVGDIMRNQIDGLSQMLIDLGALPAESAENIRQNIGSYMTRAYEVFDNKDWAKKVKQEQVDKARDFFRTQLLSIATQNAMSSGRSINDEVLNSLNEIQSKTKELDKLITEYNKSQSNQNKLVNKVKEVSDLMTKYGFKEGKEILDYVLSSGNNINGTKISEKIDSFFKRVSIIKNSATSSKTSGIDLNTQLEIDIENQINKILDKDIENGFVSSGKEGSKDLSILKQKMDIPLEIRALMGEYTDPVQNYANSVYKMANLAYNTKFLNDLKKNGMGTIFFEEGDVNRPKEFNTKIAADSTKTFDPLGGLMTTKEIADEFNKSSKVKSLANAANEFKGYEYYMKALRSVKWLKTIGSVATHGKNVFGNLDFMLSNGYLNFNEYRKSFNVIKNDLLNKGNKDLQEKLLEYTDAGIINQNVGLNEIKSMFKDGDFDKTFERRMNKPGESKISRLGRYLKSKTIGVKEGLENAYQAEDDFFKIVAYETEKRKYSEAFYGKDFNSLNQDEKKDVTDYVKEIVKNILPNYSRIPNSAKMLKVIPVAGTFISFSLESLRTSYNTVALAFTEMKSDNPKIKAIGAKRFVALTAIQSLKYGLMYMLSSSFLGDEEEDEDDKNKNAKRFVAPWSKNSNIVITDMGNGKFSFVDFSASDPRAQVPKALNAFSSGENFVDSLVESVKEFTSPYLSQDILFSLVTELKDNKDSFGREIYNEYDKPVDKINKIMARVWKTFEPGTLTSIRKISESENKVNDAVGQITGYKVIDVDAQKQYYFNSKKNFEETLKAKQIYNKAFRKFEKKEITKEELKEAYDISNESIRGILEENKKDFDAAVYFGADPLVLSQSADDAGYSKSVVYQIESGEFEDIEDKTPLTQEEAMKKIEALRERIKSRGIKNVDEIRRKAKEGR